MSDFYPEKPPLNEKESNGNIALTILSIIVFLLTFYVIFSDDILFISLLFIVLFIHEIGHFSFMKWFKYKHVKMLFVPLMGAFVQGKKKIYSQKESLLVVGAGPFPGVILGVIFFFLFLNFKEDWLLFTSITFMLLNIVNLLPLDPLDGGQLFKLLVNSKSDIFLVIFSFLSSLALIGIGYYFDSWLMMGFGFFMSFKVRNLQQLYCIRKELRSINLNYNLLYSELSNKDYAQIKSVLLDYSPTLNKMMSISDEDLDDIVSSQIDSVLINPVKKDASIIFRFMIICFWLLSFIIPLFLFVNYSIMDFVYAIYTR